MKLNPNKVAFGRHETFQPRYGWLTKGYQALKREQKIFESDNATVELGVGKNMVTSIRYGMRVFGLLENSSNSVTELAKYIFDEKKGVDPYLEDEATLWLLHWKLTTNPEQATTWFWFFNLFHKPSFTSQELQTSLQDFVKANIKNKFSTSTIKSDALVLTRMYCQSLGNTRTPMEEALDSPLALLGLISQSTGGRNFQSQPEARVDIPLGIFGYAVTELMMHREQAVMPIEELMYSREMFAAPGAVFRLSENDLITKIEKLVEFIPGVIEIRESAGIHQLYMMKNVDPKGYLEKHYSQLHTKGKAA